MSAYAFCPKCGGRLRMQQVGHSAHEVPACQSCGFIFWQNPKPTASVMIHRGRTVLMARRAVEPGRGAWDFPGGFVEPGEHPEDAARREIMEELGVAVQLETLVGIFPDVYGEDREPTFNLYYAGTIAGEPRGAADDVAEVRWFPVDKMPEPLAFSHCRDAIEALRRFLEEGGS